jgi:RNA polymerase sigma-70 factor (ECF subfamily)
LLSSLKHFVADAQDRACAQKRGGGKTIFSLDFANGEKRYCQEPTHDVSPEKLYERWWALSVLNRATQHLKAEFKTTQKQALFDRLKDHLVAERGRESYKDIAAEFGMTHSAVRVTAHRLRQRFHELVREEISQTVSRRSDIDAEIQDLFAAFAG